MQSLFSLASLFGFIQTTDCEIPLLIIILICVMSTLLTCRHNGNYLEKLSRFQLKNQPRWRLYNLISKPYDIRLESIIDINQFESLPSFCLWTISSSDFTPVSRCYFIFPSRYLFAIGLSPIFSFRRSVPPNLRCTPKQRDSMNPDRTADFNLMSNEQGYNLPRRHIPVYFYSSSLT